MKEMNPGRILIENSRKRGISQEELAVQIGVSKGAVSKWGPEFPKVAATLPENYL